MAGKISGVIALDFSTKSKCIQMLRRKANDNIFQSSKVVIYWVSQYMLMSILQTAYVAWNTTITASPHLMQILCPRQIDDCVS